MIDTLAALAARQGRVTDPGNEEQPGKILHEVRLTPRAWLGEGTIGGARPYFGSIDSTPLFLILYGTAMRWGASRGELLALLPAATAALDWIRGPGDPDGDGLLEYRASGPRSLSNQSWKDSEDAVQFPDGTLAEGAIAMVEVQGYAHRARRELAQVLRHLGHDATADALDAEAAPLRRLIRDRYWIAGPEGGPGYFALALDGGKRRVDSVASNMGHLLWCDVPSQEEAAQVAAHLAGSEMASGWGLRTLSSAMAGFNPISYHVGSVWPHDTALACEGLRRYGLDAAALAWPRTSSRRWPSSTIACRSSSAATRASPATPPPPTPPPAGPRPGPPGSRSSSRPPSSAWSRTCRPAGSGSGRACRPGSTPSRSGGSRFRAGRCRSGWRARGPRSSRRRTTSWSSSGPRRRGASGGPGRGPCRRSGAPAPAPPGARPGCPRSR